MSTSPISKITINHDCFLTIFDLVTTRLPRSRYGDPETSHDRPIVVVRTASQVCRQWRELLLSSSWIWGRVVDLGYGFLPSKRKEWMEEVVKRAGSSHLWIHGEVRKLDAQVRGHFDTHDFFIRLLDGDLGTWERIERLSIVICGRQLPEFVHRCLFSRAPTLRMFEVTLPDVGSSPSLAVALGQGRKSLFADHAPLLQTINTDHLIPVLHYLSSPWLAQIRELTVPSCVQTIDDIYTILQWTPLLESLVLLPELTDKWGAASLGPAPTPRPKANLPRLDSVQLLMNITGCARILEHLSGSLTAPSLFRISIYGSKSSIYLPDDVKQMKKHLTPYISHYFHNKSRSSGIPTAVSIKLWGGYFRFSATNDYHPSIADFLIRQYDNDWDEHATDSVHCCLLDSIAHAALLEGRDREPTIFTSIRRLDLDIRDIRPAWHQSLYSTLAVFNHVRSLKTNEYGMDAIWEIISQHLAEGNSGSSSNPSPQVQLLFPELQVLYLTSITKGQYVGLRGLLTKRKELGFSSSSMVKLDVRETDPGGLATEPVNQNFSVLEQVDGLEVVWKRLTDNLAEPSKENSEPGYEVCNYICGSGDPEQLKEVPLHPKLPFYTGKMPF